MFTPPPSPLPPTRHEPELDTHSLDKVQTGHRPMQDTRVPLLKERIHHSIRWTIILVPLALVLLAAYTRFSVHPAFFDLLSTDGDHEWTTWTNVADWSLHEPHRTASNLLVKKSVPSRLAARDTTTLAPTVPANPVLPTPFPEPFDTTLSANFSTNSCYNFFLNMTQTNAFRACRPFSLLITTSHAFETAQDNIDLMNTDVWGTCNTDISQAQCDANMSWFASSLQSSCQTDLANQVETAVNTLKALHAYDLMRDAACQVDPATDSYCYVEAVANSDPSSYWFYQLPLALPLGPKITTSACNLCTSGLMTLYASALDNANGTSLEGLMQTYNTAAETLDKVCGSSYAKNAQVVNSSLAWMNAGVPSTSWLVVLGLVAGALCGSWGCFAAP
ncbi:hypothetical protein L210DRAFT_3403451 [Boletus edulis BED1]|uniref:DUF7729 domain-containing protein n=1 Tax=Boletus edulis BED1 TaxID=1328754 RepID=A0AAD4GDM8_BOLED|nr:hypothetical protein L210DRAFT_3403451 [Boletus edulis BED1]